MNFPKSIRLLNGVVSIKSKLVLTDFSMKISVFSNEIDVSSIQNFKVNKNWNQAISAGLSLFDWQGLEGREVQIVSLGEKYNDRTRRYFRAYDLYIAEE